jgi:proline iminopeptidase
MKHILIISIAVIVAISAGGFALFQYFTSQPLYKPGMVRTLPEPFLCPSPQQDEGKFWQMPDNIKLFHFGTGSGRPVLVVHGGPGYPITSPLKGLTPLEQHFHFHYYDQRGCGKSSRPIDRLPESGVYKNMQLLEKTLGLTA